jgi:hypothetical protein
MSGFEVAGIVLAVLPLFVEAGKSSHAAAAHGAASPAMRDEKLLGFYEEFWWETWELQKQVEKVVMGLPAREYCASSSRVSSPRLAGYLSLTFFGF